MLKMTRKPSKKLAKLVLATLMFSGVAQFAISPSVVEADELTVTGAYWNSDNSTFLFSPNPISMYGFGSTGRYAVYVPNSSNVTVLNLGPKEGVWDSFSVAGHGDPTTDVSGYTVNVNGANLITLYGAYTESGTASDNHVKVIDGSITTAVGAYSKTGDAIKNDVEIKGGTVSGYFAMAVVGGWSQSGNANTNTVEIKGGSIGSTYGAVAGGWVKSGTGNANENIVNISGGVLYHNAYGGSSEGGNANNNTVTIEGGTVYDRVYGGSSEGGNANGNTVTISGDTTIDNNYEYYAYIYGGKGSTSASNNTVTIKGDASVIENTYIYGGVAESYVGIETVGGTAANNTVNILKPITVQGLYGGIGDEAKSTGNTLNIAAKNVVTNDVAAFQNMNFYLPKDIENNDTMLTIKGNEGMTTPANVKGVTFGVAALQGVNLKKGNTVNLVVGENGLETDDKLNTADSATLAKEEFLAPNSLATDTKYELSISKKDTNTIIATVDNVTNTDPDPKPTPDPDPDPKPTPKPDPKPDYSNNERIKSLVETRAGMVTMLNAGTDLLTGQGMSNAADAAGDRSAGGGFNAFGAVSIGKLRAESGSHVDTKGIGLNLGFAREFENSKGKLLFGPVVEYGHGSYDSYQDNGIKADGNASYWGLGVIAKQTNDNGLYYEGSLRVGRVKSDYDSDLSPVTHASYDSSATYWAAHAGIGKVMDIGKDNTLDVYGKYFYSRTGSDSVTVHGTAGDEDINFSAVNSHRLRIGTRLTHALNEKSKLYGGLAYQYEFSGDARATYNGGSTPSPSVKGSSGLLELGWQVKPGKGPMSIDLGVTGWVGKQRGVTANVQANWTF